MMFNKEGLIKATEAIVLKDTVTNETSFVISTDTRTIKKGDIYLPLKGQNFDGQKFIETAIKKGAAGYFTTSKTPICDAKLVLHVENTTEAYLNIAKYYREKINPVTVGITGSAGKTTTKEMVYAVLSQKFKTQKTFSNHNNEIGFCQTVLSMTPDIQALIVEMGMRGFGEIELITTHLNPDYAIITNSGSAHVGRLGSLDNIAKAKCEITKGLNPNGIVFAKNQDIIKKHLDFNGEKVFYSLNDVEILEQRASYTKFEYQGNIYELNIEGEYNVENSLSAINLGLKLDMSPQEISEGLKTYRPIEKRWEEVEINGLRFINDSYNANPESVKASVKTFIELYKNPVVVLGEMLELGNNSENYHQQVGEYLSSFSTNVNYILIGDIASYIGKSLENGENEVHYFKDKIQAACYIVENLNKDNTIFLKASGSINLSEILDNIKKRGICKL